MSDPTASAAAPAAQTDPEIAIKLPVSSWQVALYFLGLGAYKDVAPTIEKMQAQIALQLADHHKQLVAQVENIREQLPGEEASQPSTPEPEPVKPKSAVH